MVNALPACELPGDICPERTTCRICGNDQFASILDLGSQYIASIFVGDDVDPCINQPYPLELTRCAHPEGCGLVQLRHTVYQPLLYHNYGYLSGTNEKMRRHLEDIVSRCREYIDLKPGDAVLDIGCNDGTLLDAYALPGLRTMGVDPSPNVAAMARDKGHAVINDFFSAKTLRAAHPDARFRIISSIAMFYDLEDPNSFVRDVSDLLTDDGLWVVEMSYLPTMLAMNSYDTVCHEHLEYYTLKQVEWITWQHGLETHRVEFNDINGGSFRIFFRKKGYLPPNEEDLGILHDAREHEAQLQLDTPEPYERFNHDITRVSKELVALLRAIKDAGEQVYIYGASTKGNVILQYCGIGPELTAKAADRNPNKFGRRTLGTDVPIISEEEARADHPAYFLALPWHFIDAFLVREAEYLERGGRFILPLPEVRVVGKEGASA